MLKAARLAAHAKLCDASEINMQIVVHDIMVQVEEECWRNLHDQDNQPVPAETNKHQKPCQVTQAHKSLPARRDVF